MASSSRTSPEKMAEMTSPHSIVSPIPSSPHSSVSVTSSPKKKPSLKLKSTLEKATSLKEPTSSKSVKIIVGVDEAGRGPVLGPMVMAALAFKEEDIQKLAWLGVKDSKLLSSEVREGLFDRIHEVVHDFRIEVIEPDAIDLSLSESNLNWLEADTSSRMVSELAPHTAIIDCPSVNLISYKKYFLDKIPPPLKNSISLVVEHKADVNYLAVAAASVIAKVIRDRWIDHLKREIGIDFGSGYMSDPKTQKFLQEYHDQYPHLFRKRWESFRKAQEAKKQRSLGDF
ncbi:ribonuclease HII [Candidatus Woesearchaeota archaeon]|nr:ribonuclease HII [Candidatus Woesearchaeota archaeon]